MFFKFIPFLFGLLLFSPLLFSRRFRAMKKINIALIYMGVFMMISGFFALSGIIVLGSEYNSFDEIKVLESKNLLENPPSRTSSLVLSEINFHGNSRNMEKYLEKNHDRLQKLCLFLLLFATIFFGILGFKFYERFWKYKK